MFLSDYRRNGEQYKNKKDFIILLRSVKNHWEVCLFAISLRRNVVRSIGLQSILPYYIFRVRSRLDERAHSFLEFFGIYSEIAS